VVVCYFRHFHGSQYSSCIKDNTTTPYLAVSNFHRSVTEQHIRATGWKPADLLGHLSTSLNIRSPDIYFFFLTPIKFISITINPGRMIVKNMKSHRNGFISLYHRPFRPWTPPTEQSGRSMKLTRHLDAVLTLRVRGVYRTYALRSISVGLQGRFVILSHSYSAGEFMGYIYRYFKIITPGSFFSARTLSHLRNFIV
jgi:hypothetical protein